MARDDGDGSGQPLSGQLLSGRNIHVVGRLHGLSRARLDGLVDEGGGRLVRRSAPGPHLVVIAHSATAAIGEDGTLRLPKSVPEAAEPISENAFRRSLGLLPPSPGPGHGHSGEELARVSGLLPPVLACLVAFDVLEPVGDRFAYRDLLAAREVKRLIGAAVPLRTIVEADLELRRGGRRLTDVRLAASASGRLFLNAGGALAELSGQLTMPFAGEELDLDDAFGEAEAAERDGDLARAETLYATLMRLDQRDPVLPFNLGNVLREAGRIAEAKVAWQMAAARDPDFAEAWYNLALAAEEEGHAELAAAQYRRAAEARPDYADAHFNLALMLTRADRFAEALPVWETFFGLAATPEQVRTARRAATLCRMQLAGEGTRTG